MNNCLNNVEFSDFDHENVAMFCDANYYNRDNPYPLLQGGFAAIRRCLYGKDTFEYVLEYGKKFWETYKDNKKFLRLGFIDAHERTQEVVKYLDEPLYLFLNDLFKKKLLENAVIFFVSDHGNGMYGYYRDIQADDFLFERTIAFWFMILEGYNNLGEAVYTKSINREECEKKICDEIGEKSPIELAKKYYPYFYDGPEVNKIIVPITDEYHEKLFLSKSQQSSLSNDITVSRNTIKKAYLSNTPTNINVGDILLFYQTHTNQGISEIGVVESSHKDLSLEDIIKTVGKRSVFSQDDLKRFDGKNFSNCS